MNRRFVLVLLPILLVASCKTSEKSIDTEMEFFAGEIHSITEIIPANENVNVDSIRNQLVGVENRYYIQDSLYKSMHFTDGDLLYYYVYEPSTKRMYDYYHDRPYITFRDSRVNRSDDPDSKFEPFPDSLISVLGVEAYLVKVELFGIKSDVFYSKNLKINSTPFLDHSAGGWNETLALVEGALPLHSIRYLENHTEIKKTHAINKGKQPLDFFRLPENMEVFPSFSAFEEKPAFIEATPDQISCYQSKASRIPDLVTGEELMEFYFRFIVTSEGDIKYPTPFNNEYDIVNEVGVEILEECGFKFIPGLIDNEAISGEIIFGLPFVL